MLQSFAQGLEEVYMPSCSTAVWLFAKEEDGLETVEYAVMTAMIASVIIVALGALMLTIGDIYGSIIGVL